MTKRLRDDPQWEATTFRCHGCAELEREMETIPKHTHGVRVALIPYDPDTEV